MLKKKLWTTTLSNGEIAPQKSGVPPNFGFLEVLHCETKSFEIGNFWLLENYIFFLHLPLQQCSVRLEIKWEKVIKFLISSPSWSLDVWSNNFNLCVRAVRVVRVVTKWPEWICMEQFGQLAMAVMRPHYYKVEVIFFNL